MSKVTKILAALSAGVYLGAGSAAAEVSVTKSKAKSLMVGDFVEALSAYGDGKTNKEGMSEATRVWVEGLAERGVDPEFVRQRLHKARTQKADFFADFASVEIEQISLPKSNRSDSEAVLEPVALHAFRLDVIEDYDDWWNDNVYVYFITTHDDFVWGRVSSIYKNLNEGTSAFFSAEDRAVFGPKGQKITPKHHLIIDIGVVESDGDDIKQLQKLSDAIVDLALVALAVYNPEAGMAAAKARAETKNLLRLVIAMDQDDRLAADSVYFSENQIARRFVGARTVSEFSRRYSRDTTWTSFDYRLRFRFLK